ncbi:hypothetical protein ACHHYP_13584 [Achlya hypogyna]|uniref:Fe2OG dioxygenase domain-containing protein n=1 Tax=Achlya hypogyna TaxID=1202772 RepID=A0A1V9YEV4_ACHHY|nr:hypothetical protein ACHHYP_13584 [Achlya hypogyna]
MLLRQTTRRFTAAAAVDAQLRAVTARLPAAGAALRAQGFYVVDDAVPPALAHALRDEIAALHTADRLYPNATHVYAKGEAAPLLLEKTRIYETELLTVEAQYGHLQRWFENAALRTALNDALPTLRADRHMIKVQYNQGGGGCFPMHFDTYGDDGKCLTAVLYLNEVWQPGDGGEIVMYPFPYAPTIIAPTSGRLVLFSSQRMLHRVLPSAKPRFCLTTWMYRDASLNRAPPPVASTSGDAYVRMMAKLCASPFRAHLAKLFYADEWRASLEQSHAATPAFAAYLKSFDREMATIAAATAQMLANFAMKDTDGAVPATPAALLARIRADFQSGGIDRRDLVAWF